MVVRYGVRIPELAAVPGVARPTLTRVALAMSIMTEPACVLILSGLSLLPDFDQGSIGPSGTQFELTDPRSWRDVCMVVAVGGGEMAYSACVEECLSSNGSPEFSSDSRRMSLGPKDVAARGDLAAVFLVYVGGGRSELEDPACSDPALITSGFATPNNWRMGPLVGVMIMGASAKSLANVMPDM